MGNTFLAAVIKVWARKSVASQKPIFGMLECVDSCRSSHHPLALSTYLTGSHRIGPDSDKRSLPMDSLQGRSFDGVAMDNDA